MALILVTAPTVEPVSLVEAKAHLRVDIDDDDTLIAGLVTAAREYVERICRPQLALITQTWRLVLDDYPGNTIELRPYPLQSVTSIKTVDEAAAEATISSADYVVDTSSSPGRVRLKSSASWPSTDLQELNGFQVTFVAGFGDLGASVPQAIRQAMLLLLGHWYENREPQITTGAVPASLAFTVQALLGPWRREV
jgi:uncharacterized phiE125 gp8 family phage protein